MIPKAAPPASSLATAQNGAEKTMATFGKSFYWASRFFDQDTAGDIATLYSFCRMVDDIADHQPVDQAVPALNAIRTDLDRGTSNRPIVEDFLALCQRTGIDLDIPRHLVDAIAADTGSVQMARPEDLLRYAYGVASTVGLMMCAVMGVRETVASPFAVDLGIAMQLTNIARDVVEDAEQDRCYLPQSWFEKPLSAGDIRQGLPHVRQQIETARGQLLDLADRYYRSADRGLRFIPLRGRLAVATASRVYEAIGTQVRSPSSVWGRRAYVNLPGKVWHTARAVCAVVMKPAYWNHGPLPVHDHQLHSALTGLPGTHGHGQ